MNAPQLILIAAMLLGALGLALLLPRASRRGRMAGLVLAAISMGLLASQMSWLGRISGDIVFVILAGVTVVAAVGTDLPPAQLLVPSRLIVDVPGAGQQTLGQSARMLDRSASQDALIVGQATVEPVVHLHAEGRADVAKAAVAPSGQCGARGQEGLLTGFRR